MNKPPTEEIITWVLLVANVIPKPMIAIVRRKSGMRILLVISVLVSFLSGSSYIDTLANNIPTADIVSKIPTVALSNKSCSLTTNGTPMLMEV